MSNSVGDLTLVSLCSIADFTTTPSSKMVRATLKRTSRSELELLLRAIAAGDRADTERRLAASPDLALRAMHIGATRQAAVPFFLDSIGCYVYAGDTPLHIAAAAYRAEIACELVSRGADVRATNRRGAQPLHSASVGQPGSRTWRPEAQASVIEYLIRAGADPNAPDKSGATPLHRAVRTRCAAAVQALLALGADVRRANGSGSTPLHLAVQTTGRSGSGSPDARAQQAEIIKLLAEHGAQVSSAGRRRR